MNEHDDRLGAVRKSIGHRETETGAEIDLSAPVIDFRDLRPKGRGDRRVEPRRASERGLHYAEQILLSQACAYVDMLLDQTIDDDDERLLSKVADLTHAVVTFREQADKVRAEREGST